VKKKLLFVVILGFFSCKIKKNPRQKDRYFTADKSKIYKNFTREELCQKTGQKWLFETQECSCEGDSICFNLCSDPLREPLQKMYESSFSGKECKKIVESILKKSLVDLSSLPLAHANFSFEGLENIKKLILPKNINCPDAFKNQKIESNNKICTR
jgi:hypothetical protein